MADWKSRIAILVLVVTAAAMLADLSRAPRSTYTAANYERLQPGMTMKEAVAVLGEPDAVDHSLQQIAWATWYSPFDRNSFISGVFTFPDGTLQSKEQHGELPTRPMLMPDKELRRKRPSFLVLMRTRRQVDERRAMLMLDPPKPPSNDPFIP